MSHTLPRDDVDASTGLNPFKKAHKTGAGVRALINIDE